MGTVWLRTKPPKAYENNPALRETKKEEMRC